MIEKARIFFDIEKEEVWLNKMSSDGLRLVKRSFIGYYFEKCEPNKYIYRLEKRKVNEEENDYMEFLQDLNINLVSKQLGWHYYEKENDGRGFEIYTDTESKINHFKRLISFLLFVILGSLCILNSHYNDQGSTTPIINPVLLFNTIIITAASATCFKYVSKINKLKKQVKIDNA